MTRSNAACALAAALLLAGCAPRASGPPGGEARAASPAPSPSSSDAAVPLHIETQAGGGRYVTIVQTVPPGRKVYTIRALSSDASRSASGDAAAILAQPHVTFLDRSGRATIADAPKATVTERNKTVIMTGGVRATTSDGSVMTCDRLTYTGLGERLHGEGHVVLTSRDGITFGGSRLDGDVRLQTVRVTR